MYNPQTIGIVGLALTGVIGFLAILGLFRNNIVVLILIVLTTLIAIFGWSIRNEVPVLKGGNPSEALHGPFIFITGYAILRFIYKKIYKVEPTYDPGWNCRAMDVIVHLLPLFAGMLLPLIYAIG